MDGGLSVFIRLHFSKLLGVFMLGTLSSVFDLLGEGKFRLVAYYTDDLCGC